MKIIQIIIVILCTTGFQLMSQNKREQIKDDVCKHCFQWKNTRHKFVFTLLCTSSSSSIMLGCRFTKAAHTLTIDVTYGLSVSGITPRNMEKHLNF